MGSSISAQKEDEIEETKYTCINQPYKHFDRNLHKFVDTKGTLVCWIITRNGIDEESRQWVLEEDGRFWMYQQKLYQDGKLKETKNFHENGNGPFIQTSFMKNAKLGTRPAPIGNILPGNILILDLVGSW